MTPVGAAITLPPRASDRIGTHAEPHSKLEDPRKRAICRQTDDKALQYTDLRIGFHAPDEICDGVGRKKTIGIEDQCEIVPVAPAVAKILNVSGLVSGVIRPAPIECLNMMLEPFRQPGRHFPFLTGDLFLGRIA